MESSMRGVSRATARSRSIKCMLDAQDLNNLATVYIETGKYDIAIATLQDGLRQWEEHRVIQVNSRSQPTFCMCRHCTLDTCIAFSEKRDNQASNNYNGNDSSRNTASTSERGNKRRRLSVQKSISLNENGNYSNADDKRKTSFFSANASNQEYTYQNPIRIPKHHNMGSTCFFIIMFNLALATHLKALNSTAETNKKEVIQAAMNLYELIFEYWSRLQADSNVTRAKHIASNSLRFMMILFNNMGQMYRMVNQVDKQKQCLQTLLSMVMITVEWNTRTTGTNQITENQTGNNNQDTFQQSIDGFLMNVMPPSQCAEAA